LKLKDFQDRFQRAIIAGDDSILKDIPDGPHETKANLLGIYRDAYVLRLIGVLASDHERLHAYLGDDSFRAMARAYIARYPSRHPNARWFSQRLPEFLREAETYSKQPVLSELAGLERALSNAFDGKDAPVVSMADLAALPPEIWGGISFVRHPTATSFDAHSNVAAIWRALRASKEPPQVHYSETPIRILVWRHEATPMFREMSAEETMMWEEAGKGARFADLCTMLAVYDDPATAPARAAGFLKTWLDAGLLSKVVAEPVKAPQ
jgi:putative DNA-binding protein